MEQIISMLLYFCVIGFLLYFIGLLGYSMLKGAPYAAVGTERLTTMIELARIKKGEKTVDLGSGDGRIVAACANVGAQAYGYEINPILVFISRRLLKRNEIKIAHIYQRSYWNADLSQFQVVTLYGTTHIMNGLEKKLRKELRPGSRVVSNHFRFPHWKYVKKKHDVYLYKVS